MPGYSPDPVDPGARPHSAIPDRLRARAVRAFPDVSGSGRFPALPARPARSPGANHRSRSIQVGSRTEATDRSCTADPATRRLGRFAGPEPAVAGKPERSFATSPPAPRIRNDRRSLGLGSDRDRVACLDSMPGGREPCRGEPGSAKNALAKRQRTQHNCRASPTPRRTNDKGDLAAAAGFLGSGLGGDGPPWAHG